MNPFIDVTTRKYVQPWKALAPLGCLALLLAVALPGIAADKPKEGEGIVHVAALVYANGKTSQCFSAQFLATADRQSKMRVDRAFHKIDLTDQALFNYPFAIWTGEGEFKLADAETTALKTYLNRGGFLLASPGCSNAAWSASFHQAMAKAFPDARLKAVKIDHPMFHTMFDIREIRGNKPTASPADEEIDVMEINGRVAVVFSALGLNDTANSAGEGCCCCGGNEIRDASRINADILSYALTH